MNQPTPSNPPIRLDMPLGQLVTDRSMNRLLSAAAAQSGRPYIEILEDINRVMGRGDVTYHHTVRNLLDAVNIDPAVVSQIFLLEAAPPASKQLEKTRAERSQHDFSSLDKVMRIRERAREMGLDPNLDFERVGDSMYRSGELSF